MSMNRSENYSLRQQARFGYITLEVYHAELSDRNAAWSRLSPIEQLAALDRRLGKGIGAKRQRAIIAARLTAPVKPATLPPNGGKAGNGLTDTPHSKKKKGK